MSMNQSGAPMVRIGDWVKEGWDIFVSDIGMFMLAGLIYTALVGLCFPILIGPLSCGMYIIVFDRMRGGAVDLGRLFAGFEDFGTSFTAGLIYCGLMFAGLIVGLVGMLIMILPSLVGMAAMVAVQTVFLFTFQLIVDRGLSATEAISVSYNKIRENLGEFLLFSVALAMISAAGSFAMVGFVLTVPLTFAATAVAYRDIFGMAGAWEPTTDTLRDA